MKNSAVQKPFFSFSNHEVTSAEYSAGNAHTPFFQPALTIGQPNDKYEREADTVADKVTGGNIAVPVVQQQPISQVQKADLQEQTALQRQPEKEEEKPVQKAAEKEEEEPMQMAVEKEEEKPVQKAVEKEEEPVQKQADKEEEEPIQAKQKEEEEAVQTKIIPGNNSNGVGFVSTQLGRQKGNGEALPTQPLQYMETSFGTSFDGVKIHTDSTAVQMNKAIGAKAFTHGKDIYFNSGYFAPHTHNGRHLLAHELTHVVQQTGATNPSTIFPQRRRGPAPVRRRTRAVLLDQLMGHESPLWRQLNPHADSPINCPATAAAVDEFLSTGVVRPAPSGDGLSSFEFSTAGMSDNIPDFNTVRAMLARPYSFAVVRATRSAEYLRTNDVTPTHFFTAVNYRGSIVLIDAYGGGEVITDVNAFLIREGFEYYNIFRGQFTVTHRGFDDDDVVPGIE